jgi:hypothetical protein
MLAFSIASVAGCLGAGHDVQPPPSDGDSGTDIMASTADDGATDSTGGDDLGAADPVPSDDGDPDGLQLVDPGQGDDASATAPPTYGTGIPCVFATGSITTAPNQLDIALGQVSKVSAKASIPSGGTAAYSWVAASGRFANPSAAATTFQCTATGDVTVIVTASFTSCDEQLTGLITCIDSGAGGGGH